MDKTAKSSLLFDTSAEITCVSAMMKSLKYGVYLRKVYQKWLENLCAFAT